MESSMTGRLVGWEVHGFPSMDDLDMSSVAKESHERWLRPNEIYAILCNYEHFNVCAKPIQKPASGTLILFDRKALRNFRKDGHSWQKKKDGKTVKEAHEHLKVGNQERIHVYYAHGEDNPKFVRRSYWLLNREIEHIVLVHYREVSEGTPGTDNFSGGRSGIFYLSRKNPSQSILPSTPTNSSSASGNQGSMLSEDHDSSDNASMYMHILTGSEHQSYNLDGQNNDDYGVVENSAEQLTIHSINTLEWDDLLEPSQELSGPIDNLNHANNTQNNCSSASTAPAKRNIVNSSLCGNGLSGRDGLHVNDLGESVICDSVKNNGYLVGGTYTTSTNHSDYQYWSPELGMQNHSHAAFMTACNAVQNEWVDNKNHNAVQNEWVDNKNQDTHLYGTMGNTYDSQDVLGDSMIGFISDNSQNQEFRQPSMGKQDSFGKWFSSVLEESPVPTEEQGSTNFKDARKIMATSNNVSNQPCTPGELFFISDISPEWAMSAEETKVIITGYFREVPNSVREAKWLCVFGEQAVPAEALQLGVFRCKAPPLSAGYVNFYLTCNGRDPCSQILRFEYRSSDNYPWCKTVLLQTDENIIQECALQIRLVHLLFLSFKGLSLLSSKRSEKVVKLESFINSLIVNNDGDWHLLPKAVEEGNKSVKEAMCHAFRLVLQRKLKEWLLEKIVDKKGASVRDRNGQGVIHLVAALGYDWATIPIVAIGVPVDFRDKSGWTAMHWAALYGREQVVAMLLAAGANASLVTDPTVENPSGLTPSDLAAHKGHEGLAGYLGEKALTKHLSTLTLYEKDDPRRNILSDAFEKAADMTEDELCMKDSLSALRVATEAETKIRAAFREHSYRLQLKQAQMVGEGRSKEEVLKMIAALKIQKAYRGYQDKKQLLAAKRIQHKFRGWKTRKEFITLKNNVIKIQAYFRGHRVRKEYSKILWSVGVLEKAILRWRQKRKGFRGLQVEDANEVVQTELEDNGLEDFFVAGRKAAEERTVRSAVRVQTMYRSYKARKDYSRMKQSHLDAEMQYRQLMNLNSIPEPTDNMKE